MTPPTDQTPSRYSCQECREDSELVLSNRATPSVQAYYDEHLRRCRECRRMHRVLFALYEGPHVPPSSAGIKEEKQFYGILNRMSEEAPAPWYHKLSMRAGVAALATSAAVLTLSLFDFNFGGMTFSTPQPVAISQHTTAAGHGESPFADVGHAPVEAGDGGIEHPAQSYGRIVGGHASVVPPGEQASTTNTFPVGTRFQVAHADSIQVGLVGKIVANFTPNADIEWTVSSPSLIELELDSGVAAFRYDRRPSDPILQVRTPAAVVRVIGTVFTVQVEEDDTIVSVLRGQVDVLDPKSNRLMAEVESGHRFNVASGTVDDVGKIEVQAALPLSNDTNELGGPLALADGHIPSNWVVPGLPEDPTMRTLAHVPARQGSPKWNVPSIRVSGTDGGDSEPPRPKLEVRIVEDEGEDLIEELVRDLEATRRKELKASLENCRELYNSHETRYRAARCLSTLLTKYGSDPLASEAYLLLGILRMDYALDYKAAENAFQLYLRRRPGGQNAEMALYRMWLSSTEDGRISVALKRGRYYLERYPNGRYVGKILQRFPELKSEI